MPAAIQCVQPSVDARSTGTVVDGVIIERPYPGADRLPVGAERVGAPGGIDLRCQRLGKSNLIDSIRAMKEMVLNSHRKEEPGGGVPLRRPFALDPGEPSEPDGFRCRLRPRRPCVTTTASKRRTRPFCPSGCTRFPRGTAGCCSNARVTSFTSVGRWAGRTRPSPPWSGRTACMCPRPRRTITSIFPASFAYFRSIRGVVGVVIPGKTASSYFVQEEPDARVIEFLVKIGAGIIDYRRKESAIELGHRGHDGKPVFLSMDRESAGTRRLLFVLDFVFRALDKGVPLCIDELDASLHTHASAAVLALFCSRDTNPKGAQLIATTHDSELMRWGMLRRDQLWFTDKDAGGATRIYPLDRHSNPKRGRLRQGVSSGPLWGGAFR